MRGLARLGPELASKRGDTTYKQYIESILMDMEMAWNGLNMRFRSYPLVELISTYPGMVFGRCARIAANDSPIVDALLPAGNTF